jgi:hypothetical protein
MKSEKHEETLKEVEEEIDSAIKDKRGLLPHQRRLAFSISLGMSEIIELYFHKLSIIKEGSKINHLWFKKKLINVKERLQQQLVSPIDSITEIDKIIETAIKIEEKRDDLAYGVPATEKVLQEKINLFLELRRITKC